MYIKTITYDENKRPITFNDVRFGEIFRVDGEYYIKVRPTFKEIDDKNTVSPANAVNLKDGHLFYIEKDLKIEVYTEKSITLDENKFMREMEVNE